MCIRDRQILDAYFSCGAFVIQKLWDPKVFFDRSMTLITNACAFVDGVYSTAKVNVCRVLVFTHRSKMIYIERVILNGQHNSVGILVCPPFHTVSNHSPYVTVLFVLFSRKLAQWSMICFQ